MNIDFVNMLDNPFGQRSSPRPLLALHLSLYLNLQEAPVILALSPRSHLQHVFLVKPRSLKPLFIIASYTALLSEHLELFVAHFKFPLLVVEVLHIALVLPVHLTPAFLILIISLIELISDIELVELIICFIGKQLKTLLLRYGLSSNCVFIVLGALPLFIPKLLDVESFSDTLVKVGVVVMFEMGNLLLESARRRLH